MSLPKIHPTEAKRLLERGAVLVDIREADEHAKERIETARHLPLSRLGEADLVLEKGVFVIFHCRSGARTAGHALRLADKAGQAGAAFILEGGLDAWREAGLPVVIEGQKPLNAHCDPSGSLPAR